MRRNLLAAAQTADSTHPGLWLDRYVDNFDKPAAEHLKALFPPVQGRARGPSTRVAAGYADFQRRLEQHLSQLAPQTLLAEATVAGRMAVGLGGETVLETAIAIHRTWGVPYIPGSALKGLTASAARLRLESPLTKDSTEYRLLFGEQDNAGYVTFHDALWKPFRRVERKGQVELVELTELPLMQDVMTVHHADYYGWNGKGDPAPPADWDDPNPVPFLTAHGTYLLALTGPPGWVELAFQILRDALENDGIGAKTAAGYGRMNVKRHEP